MKNEKKPNIKEVILIYAGLRIDGDSVLQCFMDGKEERWYSKVKWAIIGHKYAAQKTGETLRLSRRPENLGPAQIDAQILDEWEIKNKLAEQFIRNKRAAKRAKGMDEVIWPHIQPLHVIYNKLKGFDERDALIEYISRLIRIGHKK